MLSRRPAPSLFFTAIAATIVLLPWAVNGLPGDDDSAAPGAPVLTEQALPGLGGGETIREIHQDTPFSMVALTADDLTGTSARVRAKKDDGSWGPWYEAEPLEGVGEDTAALRGTDPVFVGRTTTVQIAVTRPADAAPTAPPATRSERPGLGYVPANVEQPFAQNINAVLISPPQAPVDTLPLPNAVMAPGVPPRIITRPQWGADESMRCGEPRYDRAVRAGVVHHTAGSNDYAPEDSAGMVRSIYEYHTRTLGWCDLGYNALIDKYGQVFEGRAGGWTGRSRDPTPAGSTPTPGGGDDGQLRPRPAHPDPAAHNGPTARVAAGPGPRRPDGHRGADVGGRVVHPLPAGRHAHAADDLHPPRRRQHRVPGQRRVRRDGRPAGHRRPVQRTSRTGGPGRNPAWRSHFRPVDEDGRDDERAGRTHLSRGRR